MGVQANVHPCARRPAARPSGVPGRRIARSVPLLLAVATAPAFAQAPKLGTIHFPTSAASAEAQEQFIRGVGYLHSFEYGSAARSFRQAQELEPGFAMAYWGEAMTHTHPVWNDQDVEAARAVLERLAPTPEARRAKAPTEREGAYLAAAEILYGEGTKAERDTAYSLAMAEMVERFPDDPEAKAFYSLSLLGLNQAVRDVPAYMRAAAVAQQVFQANPDHPGAAHYLIHSFDDPTHAPLGLPAARAYMKIAPDAPHAQHMTTHIFLALGMWDEVVTQNEIATGSAWRPHHYSFWLAYGLLQQGRHAEAAELLERVKTNLYGAEGEPPRGQRIHLAAMRAHHVVNTGAWSSSVLDWRIELADASAVSRAWDEFALGYAALQRGERAAAESALERLAGVEGGEEDGDAASVPEILGLELRAALQYAAGAAEPAIDLLREATALEDAMPFGYGPPSVVKPSHELLGDVLLEMGRAAEAQREYEAALRLAPNRALSLLGLARAARAAGDEKAARRAETKLQEVWHRADSSVSALATAGR